MTTDKENDMTTIERQMKGVLWGTVTNTCNCTTYNEDTGDWQDTSECYGCWEEMVEDFRTVVAPLFINGEDEHCVNGDYRWGYKFVIEGIGLWDRTVGGTVVVKDAEELLRAMTVNADYILRWKFDEPNLELSARLSHHDCPMGSIVTVTPTALFHVEQ